MDTVKGLKCRECGRGYPASPTHVCEFCFGPLEVDYDYEAIGARVSRARIEAGPPSIWRYADLLPLDVPDGEPPIGPHVGFTPLVRAHNLAREWGVRELYVKNDAVCHPTCSFKDRVVAVAVAKAREFGFDTVACASTGNLANSVAAHAAEAGLKACVFIPADLEQGKVIGDARLRPDPGRGARHLRRRQPALLRDRRQVPLGLRQHQPPALLRRGLEDDRLRDRRAARLAGARPRGGAVAAARCSPRSPRPSRSWRASGSSPTARTRMYAAQAAGCGPIVTMIQKDTDVLEPVRPQTIAKSLAIGNPADGYYAYRAAKDSGGYGEHATDEEIVDGMRLLARTEGIFAETAGGVTVAATRKLIEAGRIPRDEPIVMCITGNGLKTPDVLHDRLGSDVTIQPSLQAFDRALADLTSRTVA